MFYVSDLGWWVGKVGKESGVCVYIYMRDGQGHKICSYDSMREGDKGDKSF